MNAKAQKLPYGCIALDGAAPLVSEGETLPETVFEREIALTGEYKTRGFALARKQFDEVIANHKASGVDPAVDRGHETWLGADPGTEARGWVRALSIRPSASHPNRDALVASIELNDLGRNAVANKHFRYLSMGIDLKAKDKMTGKPLGAVLDHLALVKRPFIEGMQPLSLSADSQNEQENHAMMLTLKALGLKDDATDAEMCAVVAAKDAEINALKASHESTAKALSETETLVKKFETELAEQTLGALVDKHIDTVCNLDRAKRDWALAIGRKDIELLKTILADLPKLNTTSLSDSARSSGKTLSEHRQAEQAEALAAYKKAHPEASTGDAYAACAEVNPALFDESADQEAV